jgi:hypothetical protein
MPGGPTFLRLLITARHWQKFETFEAQFRRAAAELGAQQDEPRLRTVTVSVRQFERWYSGQVKTRPHPDSCRVLEHMFGQPVDQLLASANQVTSQTILRTGGLEEIHNPAFNARDTEIRTVGPRAIWAQDEDRSGPNYVLPAGHPLPMNSERIVAMAARKAFRFGTSADSSNAGRMALDQLLAETARLAVAYEQLPLPEVVGDIAALQDQAFVLLEGRQRPRETRELYVIAGLASGLIAKCANDLADTHAAMTHARAAIVCSENAEVPSLTAWIRGIQCLITYWAGSPRETIRYAQLGLQLPEVTGSVTVWLHSLEARAWAALGNAQESIRAVNLANDAREAMILSELDRLGGFCYFPRPRQLYYAAGANALLPAQSEQAERYAKEALTEYEVAPATERAWSDVLGTHTDLAIARVNGSDLDGASEAIRPVLELPVPQRIHGMVVSVLKVHQAITAIQPDAPLARDLQEEIEAYCRTPAASLPR